MFFAGRTHINEKRIIQSKSHQNRYYTSWYLCLIKSYLVFFTLELNFKMTLSHLIININRRVVKKYHGKEVLQMLIDLFVKKSYFRLHDLEINSLTSKMTLNH